VLGCSVATAQSSKDPVVTSLLLFAGTPRGLFRSRDWGASWVRLEGKQDPRGAIRAIFPVGPQVYAGGDEGLFSSVDFGQTWTRLELEAQVLCILTSRYPLADPTLLVGTTKGLVRSADGKTFRPTSLQGTPVWQMQWPGPALLLATGRGVLTSVNSGETFAGPGSGVEWDEVRAMAHSSFFPVDPVLFAGVGNRGVVRSSDGGKTWVASGLTDRRVSDLVWLGPTLYATTEAGVYRSENAGKTWSLWGQGLLGQGPRRLLFPLAPDSGAEIFVSTDKGISHSQDGGLNWLRSGMVAEEVLCIATFPPPQKAQKPKPK